MDIIEFQDKVFAAFIRNVVNRYHQISILAIGNGEDRTTLIKHFMLRGEGSRFVCLIINAYVIGEAGTGKLIKENNHIYIFKGG